MPSNLSPEQIKVLLCDAVDAQATGSSPASDSEIIKIKNAIMDTNYSINPSTVPPPKLHF